MTSEPRDPPQFYLTSPAPCPYLPGKEERKVFTHLVGRRAGALNDALTHSGFRRSQTIAYRPACENCKACVSVRILCAEFSPNRTQRKLMARNADLSGDIGPARADVEQFRLFRTYLDSRHSDGGMADMAMLDYGMMVEDSHVESRIALYRLPPTTNGLDADLETPPDAKSGSPLGAGLGQLAACCLTDVLEDGLSMVYSFYDPALPRRSLGAYMILDHIEKARALGLPHLYLGYWVEGSRKMDYKAQYLPQERLGPGGWTRVG
ncbi:arginyltransferase [Rhodoblastus sphagnicola]|uniref:Aspartate/glutamate leucyltransferase n=1 Tax=Rhodoblastus sphagnicola TaxID=333368 RepID=A0A2S6MVL1_9HYPH|nr:arginyltransferase [Rhodoblastus sphagnicola]MBB4198387.1 arginine-tRNA-protein transferase [Rhodoblastus sphagnicola]PPQ26404.1 arginyltransferase [Rhodoblastus sphagnicola]